MQEHLIVTGIETCTGEVSIICSRGKKRLGYDLELKIKFTGLKTYEGAEGAIKLHELCDDGSHQESNVYITKEKSAQLTKKLREDIQMKKAVEELDKKCREVLEILKNEA